MYNPAEIEDLVHGEVTNTDSPRLPDHLPGPVAQAVRRVIAQLRVKGQVAECLDQPLESTDLKALLSVLRRDCYLKNAASLAAFVATMVTLAVWGTTSNHSVSPNQAMELTGLFAVLGLTGTGVCFGEAADKPAAKIQLIKSLLKSDELEQDLERLLCDFPQERAVLLELLNKA